MLSFKFTSLWPNTEDALHRSPLFSWSIFELLSALPQPHTLTDTACLPLEVRNVLWLSATATPSKNSWASNGTHSSPLAWKIPWSEEPGGLQSMGSLRVGHNFHFSRSCIGEGNGNPLHVLARRIPETGEPSGLPSMGSHRVGHDWSDLAAAAALTGVKSLP